MEEKLPNHSPHIPPTGIRIGLFIILIISWFGIYSSVMWIYEQIHVSLGFELAQVTVSLLVILISFLILLGFGFGFGLDRVVRREDIKTIWFYQWLKNSWICKCLWGDIPPIQEIVKSEPVDETPAVNIQDIITRPRRRGRIPTYSLDRWTRVVLAWENRDTLRNPITLSEFLSLEFGTYADGSPRMSENSYYDWRKRVIEELQKQEQKK